MSSNVTTSPPRGTSCRDHPANTSWQARMAELLEVADDYGTGDNSLPLVWELP